MGDLYRESPAFRFGLRTVVAAVLMYLVSVFSQGIEFFAWGSFLWGLGGAVVGALLGVLTPLEPFVGIKPKNVEVPVPPASPES